MSASAAATHARPVVHADRERGGASAAPGERAGGWVPRYVLGVFLALGALAALWQASVVQLAFLAVVGAAVAGGMAWDHRLPRERRGRGARASLLVVGLGLALGAGVSGRQSFQLEGLFFHLLHGALSGVVVHYAVAKVVGPLLFGRAWCGWGCWTWMTLSWLPWSGERRGAPFAERRWLRVGHLVGSAAVTAGLVLGFGYDPGFVWATSSGAVWFAVGAGLYTALGVALAAALRDNRAFCRLVCPVSVILEATASRSLLRVVGHRERCTGCRRCERVCPMRQPIAARVADGRGPAPSQCVQCHACVAECPRGALEPALALPRRPSLGSPGTPP